MQLRLDAEPVIVVGAAGAIGAAMCAAFAQAGAAVGLVDQSPDVLVLAQRLERELGTSTAAVVADAADAASLASGIDVLLQRLGDCRHAVVAVGMGSGSFGAPFWNVPLRAWEPVLRINIMACVNTAQLLVPTLVRQREGSLCFLASVAGQIGSSTDPPYSAAKAAVLNFTQCAARDLAPYGIRVNAICPGMVKSRLNESVWRAWAASVPESEWKDYDQWAQDKISRVTPLGRWQEVSELAALAVFLSSPLGRNITGQTLNVDGGQVMHS